MDRKNINRGFKKLRVWQDAVSLYVLACKIFANFSFKIKIMLCSAIHIPYHVTTMLAVHPP
jgi:hypothetical protein